MTQQDKPEYCFSSNCPQAVRGRGFALGCGPTSAAVSIMFERPTEDELAYSLKGPLPPNCSTATAAAIVKWREEEIARRRAAYPELEERFIIRGAPTRGMSGAELSTWVFPAVGGLTMEECYLENVLHCAAPGEAEMYPKADEAEVAEACCAHWNRLITEDWPIQSSNAPSHFVDVSVVSLHPASLLKDEGGGIVALPLQIDSFKKAKAFAKSGLRILVLAGGRATKFWLGYGAAVTRWIGHWQNETEATWTARMSRIGEGLKKVAEGPWVKRSGRKKQSTKSTESSEPRKPRKKKGPPMNTSLFDQMVP